VKVPSKLTDVDTEVRYGGVIVGRSPQIRDRDDAGAFLVFAEPLPVGTPIVIKLDEQGGREQHARVTEVVESADASAAGMRVRFLSAAERSGPHRAAPAPSPAAVAAAPPPEARQVAAAAEPSQPSSSPVPVPVGGDASAGSEGVPAGESSAHHAADPNAPHHHDGEGGRRRRRRK
jgi:hypothetical protein